MFSRLSKDFFCKIDTTGSGSNEMLDVFVTANPGLGSMVRSRCEKKEIANLVVAGR